MDAFDRIWVRREELSCTEDDVRDALTEADGNFGVALAALKAKVPSKDEAKSTTPQRVVIVSGGGVIKLNTRVCTDSDSDSRHRVWHR